VQLAPFQMYFPTLAEKETRCITLTRPCNGIDPDKFAFVELFCDDASCDCRRAMIQVFDSRNNFRACLSYGWENHQFYADWMGSGAHVDNLAGVNLYEMQPQGKHCNELLELFKQCIESDPSYAQRIQRHYYQIKEFRKKSKATPSAPLSIKTGKKIGRNENCPCRSGKKFKNCCLNSRRLELN
jgi:hypothetical protein